MRPGRLELALFYWIPRVVARGLARPGANIFDPCGVPASRIAPKAVFRSNGEVGGVLRELVAASRLCWNSGRPNPKPWPKYRLTPKPER